MTCKQLNSRQRRFVDEYLVDLSATQAAIRSGYSEDTARAIGSENLTKPDIQAAIESAMTARSLRTQISQDYVLGKIKETIDRCSQAEPVKSWDPQTGNYVETGEWTFSAAAVLKGCEMLGKHLGLFTERVELSATDGLAERLAKARKRMSEGDIADIAPNR